MTAFNIVRLRVKPDQVENFIEAHRKAREPFKNFGGGWLVKTGEQTFCIIGQWKSFDDIVAARPNMVGILDEMRGMLEDLGTGLGVTDPVSGEVVAEFGSAKPAKKIAKKARGVKATKKAAKKPAGSARKTTPAKKRAPAARKPKPPAKKTARKAGR